MIKTIVVPIDGSDQAESALSPAVWLASRFDAALRLMTSTFATDDTDAREMLDRTRKALPDDLDAVDTEIVHHQFAPAAIVAAAEAAPDAALCMSTRGRTGIGALLLGSVADEVLRSIQVPVVLVGPEVEPMHTSPKHLIVCVDGSEESATILPTAAAWTADLQLHAKVVCVVDAHQLASFPTEAMAPLDDAVETLRDAGASADAVVLEGVQPAEKIVLLANEVEAALIVVATHGRGGFSERALGRVATDLVHHSPCPVLVQRISR